MTEGAEQLFYPGPCLSEIRDTSDGVGVAWGMPSPPDCFLARPPVPEINLAVP